MKFLTFIAIQKVEISDRDGETEWIFFIFWWRIEKVHAGPIKDVCLLGTRPHVETI